MTIPPGSAPVSPRTAGDLASLDDAYDTEATPLARAAQHSLLARQTRAPVALRRRAASAVDPGDGGRQPEGRRRQDDDDRQRRRRAGPARPARPGHRPRPPGQRLDGAERRAPPRACRRRTTALVEGQPLAEIAQPCPDLPNLYVVPATIDLAGAEIELVSVVAREGRLRKAIHGHPLRRDRRGAGRRRRGPLRLRAHRLPAVARAADPQRPGRRRRDDDPDPGGVLRARGARASCSRPSTWSVPTSTRTWR